MTCWDFEFACTCKNKVDSVLSNFNRKRGDWPLGKRSATAPNADFVWSNAQIHD